MSLPTWLLDLMKMEAGDEFDVEPIGKTEIRLRPVRKERDLNRSGSRGLDG